MNKELYDPTDIEMDDFCSRTRRKAKPGIMSILQAMAER